MLEREQLLKVSDAVLAVDKANARLNMSKQLLEEARAAVEAARGQIDEAKEAVAQSKSELDGLLGSFDAPNVSKAAIIKAAEEINRIFGDIGLTSTDANEPTVTAPEIPKANERQLIETVRSAFMTYFDDKSVNIVSRSELAMFVEDLCATLESTSNVAKDDASPAKQRRKRRSKTDESEEKQIEVASAEDVGESLAVLEVSEPHSPDLDVVTASEDIVEEVVAEIDSPSADSSEIFDTDVSEPALEEQASTAPKTDDLSINQEVRDELSDFIDNNVSDENLNSLLIAAVWGVYFKSVNDKQPLSFDAYLDALAVKNIEQIDGASYLSPEMSQHIKSLLEDRTYLEAVIEWFKVSLRDLEDGKDFSPFVFNDENDATVEDDQAIDDSYTDDETISSDAFNPENDFDYDHDLEDSLMAPAEDDLSVDQPEENDVLSAEIVPEPQVTPEPVTVSEPVKAEQPTPAIKKPAFTRPTFGR